MMVGTRIRYCFRDDRAPCLTETMKIGAFADKKRQFEPELILPEPPFCKFFSERLSLNGESNNDSEESKENESLTTAERKNEKNGNSANNTETNTTTTGGETVTMNSTNDDDFIMKAPFAQPSETLELSQFFREWQTAPILETFKEIPVMEGEDLQKQLETFESDLGEFDSLVQSLCDTSPNNN